MGLGNLHNLLGCSLAGGIAGATCEHTRCRSLLLTVDAQGVGCKGWSYFPGGGAAFAVLTLPAAAGPLHLSAHPF
jgi:hypothetical protein